MPRAVAWILTSVFGLLAAGFVFLECGSGRYGQKDSLILLPFLVPVLGAASLVMTPVFWIRDKRRDFLGSSRRRDAYLGLLAVGALWLAAWPMEDVVVRASASVSRERVLDVDDAAKAFRDAKGRRPESIQDLDALSGRRLPRPTLGEWWHDDSPSHGLTITFCANSPWSDTCWRYDVVRRTWAEGGSD